METWDKSFFDIDPNNIERVDILKGLAATTLTERKVVMVLSLSQLKVVVVQSATQTRNWSILFLFVNEVSILPDLNKYGCVLTKPSIVLQ